MYIYLLSWYFTRHKYAEPPPYEVSPLNHLILGTYTYIVYVLRKRMHNNLLRIRFFFVLLLTYPLYLFVVVLPLSTLLTYVQYLSSKFICTVSSSWFRFLPEFHVNYRVERPNFHYHSFCLFVVLEFLCDINVQQIWNTLATLSYCYTTFLLYFTTLIS